MPELTATVEVPWPKQPTLAALEKAIFKALMAARRQLLKRAFGAIENEVLAGARQRRRPRHLICRFGELRFSRWTKSQGRCAYPLTKALGIEPDDRARPWIRATALAISSGEAKEPPGSLRGTTWHLMQPTPRAGPGGGMSPAAATLGEGLRPEPPLEWSPTIPAAIPASSRIAAAPPTARRRFGLGSPVPTIWCTRWCEIPSCSAMSRSDTPERWSFTTSRWYAPRSFSASSRADSYSSRRRRTRSNLSMTFWTVPALARCVKDVLTRSPSRTPARGRSAPGRSRASRRTAARAAPGAGRSGCGWRALA